MILQNFYSWKAYTCSLLWVCKPLNFDSERLKNWLRKYQHSDDNHSRDPVKKFIDSKFQAHAF